ncbi:MAG: hypothetical protein J6P40_08940 [Oscillospiraceae bacterium]|nr:hypothetical protein [Oscillospiraceae bacterium]
MAGSDDRTRQKRWEEFDNRPYEAVPDAVTGYNFPERTMRECPHPAVRKKYQFYDGRCPVSPWTCKSKCKYAITFAGHGGVACGYKGGKE